MGRVLISPQELAEIMKREPVVLIDTRDATGYGEAHIHGAVNIHDVFTYLATSTPEGVAACGSGSSKASVLTFGSDASSSDNAISHLVDVDLAVLFRERADVRIWQNV
jgi:rhodanese-related sulfurtransferase